MSAVNTSKVRLYDLAKELKIDTKRLIEEVRREGVDVSVPSNSVSKDLADKIRDKYFPKKDTAVRRVVKVVKKAARPVIEEPPPVESGQAAQPEIAQPQPVAAEEITPPAKPATTVRRLAARAEKPTPTVSGAPAPEPASELAVSESEDGSAARAES